MRTEHLASLGAREIPRKQFAALLADLTQQPAMQGWRDIARAWHPTEPLPHPATENA